MTTALAVDIRDLDASAIVRIVDLTCGQCGVEFQYAVMGRGGRAVYCADCATERQRQRQRRKEARKVRRRLETLPWMYKHDLIDAVASQGHEPLAVYRSMTCMRCKQLLGRRRGPAASTAWFLEAAADDPCWDVLDQ